MDRGPVAGADHQPGSAGIHEHVSQSTHPAGGGEAAGGQALTRLCPLQVLAALAMQEAQGVGALEADQADGLLPAAGGGGLPVPGG
ncbi:hypothetical protein AAJV73_04625 [Cyanobium sp. BSA11S]|uniref:hypothetical protein n=1 Tax=Cyanobium sp. BSA11S TaxID=3108224 RepID=UPI003D812B96